VDAKGQIDLVRKALEAGDLSAARARFEELMKMGNGPQAVQLAAEVLHELRQPLLGIKAYVQMIREEAASKAPVNLLLAQVDRMEQIISDFTRLASDRPAPKEKIALAAHAREAQRLFLLHPGSERIQLDFDVVFPVEIEGNGRLIEQLILNLLNNARDAMAGIGRIKLVITRDGARPAIYVADWGPGIPADVREKIFEPYVTSKTRGSGLGLAVCKRIAHEHNASIGIAPVTVLNESPPPATVFRVVFGAGDRQLGTEVLRRKRILVVDDEAIIRMVFTDLLGRECEVIDAETGEEALGHLKQGTFDLIITDKNLPGLSGLDLALEARRLNPASRVMLMTGYPSLVTAQQALELGVMEYLLKPFDDIREVRDKVRGALAAPPPSPRSVSTSKRIDVYEDNPSSAGQIAEALGLLGFKPNVLATPASGGDEIPAAVVVSWDFSPAHGPKAIELGRQMARGAPFVVLAEHLTMESALESLRGGAASCLPKLLSDVRALSRELSRALKLS
jgi:CheY-like chemotaxis protein